MSPVVKRRLVWSVLAPALIASGCGRPPDSDPTPALGPHGRSLPALPDGMGYVELLVEDGKNGPGAQKTGMELVVYFLESSAKGPLIPPPVDVSLNMRMPENQGRKNFELLSAPKPGDQVGRARFAAPAGDFDGQARGTLSAKFGGQVLSVTY